MEEELLTNEDVSNLIRTKKVLETDSIIRSNLLKQYNNSVRILKKVYVPIEKEFINQVTINEAEKTFKTYANLILYFVSGTKLYKVSMKINFILTMNYSSIYKESDMYYFILDENTDLFKSNFYERSVDTAYSVFSSTINGKVNEVQKLPYSELALSLIDTLENNEIGGNMLLPIEIMIAGLCRNKNDVSKEFRFSASESKDSSDNFQMINIREIPRNTSSFSAISSENITEGLITTIGNSKKGNARTISPLESIALNKF